MKVISTKLVLSGAVLAVLAAGLVFDNASATPSPNSAAIFERVFNDCPSSNLTTVNNYPMLISFEDLVLDCGGWANLHAWRFSEDGGATAAVFNNDSGFAFCAILTISGEGEGEAGLNISPWWSQLVDGRIHARTSDGEVACWGGRLPFYSFTANHGVLYEKGNAIQMSMTYLPHGLSMASPATVQYSIIYDGVSYSSGPLPFDEGNPAEGYGSWGMLDDGRVGGFLLAPLQGGNPDAGIKAEWTHICFQNLDVVPTESSTWGSVKSLYR
jgi:hypothetical protein